MQVKFARTLLAGAAVAAGLFVFAPAANAQIVVQANYGGDTDFGVGAGVGFNLGQFNNGTKIAAEATFDYFFPSCDGCDAINADFKVWEINANARAHLIPSLPSLYLGAGARYYKWDYSFDNCGIYCDLYSGADGIGLNIIGGWVFSGSNGPFVQAKLEVGDGSQFVATAGIRF